MNRRYPCRVAMLIFSVLAVVVLLFADEAKPALSGVWIFNSERSKDTENTSGPIAAGRSAAGYKWDRNKIVIKADADTIKIEVNETDPAGNKRTEYLELVVNNWWKNFHGGITDFPLMARAYWYKEKYLVIETEKFFFSTKHDISDIFGIFDDGKTLKISRKIEEREFDNPMIISKEPKSVKEELLFFKRQ